MPKPFTTKPFTGKNLNTRTSGEINSNLNKYKKLPKIERMPKLFDVLSENKSFLQEISFSIEKKTGKLTPEQLTKTQEVLNEVKALKERECKLEIKNKGAYYGFIITDKTGDKVFIKKDDGNNALETIFVTKVLYNMGMGPKVDFEKTDGGFVVLSKDLKFSRNNSGRTFYEGNEEIAKKQKTENAKLRHISKILFINDISSTDNVGFVVKPGQVNGKIFDFLPNATIDEGYEHFKPDKIDGFYASQFSSSSTANKDEFMKNVKLDKEGNFMGKHQRSVAKPENKASFEKVVEVSFEQTKKEYERLGGDQNLDLKSNFESFENYKNEVLKRGEAEINLMDKSKNKGIVR